MALEVENRPFGSKLEMAKYLYEKLTAHSRNHKSIKTSVFGVGSRFIILIRCVQQQNLGEEFLGKTIAISWILIIVSTVIISSLVHITFIDFTERERLYCCLVHCMRPEVLSRAFSPAGIHYQ